MALYVIGDLHLSLSGNKSMDIFPGWHNYVDRTQQNWLAKIQPEDTVVLAGDTSWGMSFAEAKADFEFVNALPGQKIILKGNHDYWWATMNKMNAFFAENGFDTLHILHNNHYLVEGICVCGSRGWLFDQGEPADRRSLPGRRDGWRLPFSPPGTSRRRRWCSCTIRRCMVSSSLRRSSKYCSGTRSAAAITDISMEPDAAMPSTAIIWGSSSG